MKRQASLLFALPLISISLCATAATNAPQITLPDVLAIELPKGVTQIGPTETPLHELLTAARSGTLAVTSDLHGKVGVGPVRVTWSAWDGAPKQGKPAAIRTARVIVLPFGMTPVGVSGDENATGGNNGARIARDPTGRVHMIWTDSGRPGGGAGAVYRRAFVGADGAVRFETEPTYVDDKINGVWNAYPALAVAGDGVQLVWQGPQSVRTRRVSRTAAGWVFGPVVDTEAKTSGQDVGPAVAVDARGGVHIVTPNGIYAFSRDGGQSWTTETVPLPPNQHMKTASIAADPSGAVHIAFSSVVARPDPPGQKLGGYWQLRAITRTVDGRWTDATDVLSTYPEWRESHSSDDVLADWVRISADQQGALHLAWHGTAASRKFGDDSAYYTWRNARGAWVSPVRLTPADPALGMQFSFAPSLTIDGDRALALTFYGVSDGPNFIGFDSTIALLRNGRIDGPLIPVTQFVRRAIAAKRPELALSARFPAAAPALWHSPDGHLWLDILELLKSDFQPGGAHLIVYHRLDLSAALARR